MSSQKDFEKIAQENNILQDLKYYFKDILTLKNNKMTTKNNQKKEQQPKQLTSEETFVTHIQNLSYACSKYVGNKQEHIMLDKALSDIQNKLTELGVLKPKN